MEEDGRGPKGAGSRAGRAEVCGAFGEIAPCGVLLEICENRGMLGSMGKLVSLIAASLASAGILMMAGCSSPREVKKRPSSYGSLPIRTDPYTASLTAPAAARPAAARSRTQTHLVTAPAAPRKSPSVLLTEVRLREDFLSASARGRSSSRAMRPRYITIHSTQNWSSGADPWRHSLALKRGTLGRLSWHFTVDDKVAVQHLPTTITGNHADYDGPGNRQSIGIEMCEHPGNSRAETVDRTAKLAAYLMQKHNIPLSQVVPHYHWPRRGKNPPNKNCPHFLLDNGRPGPKWRAFLVRVKSYHDAISGGSDNRWASREGSEGASGT